MKQRREKRETLDVIPMRVGQQDGGVMAEPLLAISWLPAPRAGAAVQHQHCRPTGVVNSTQEVLPPK